VPGVRDPARFWHELLQGDERLNAEGIPCLSAHDPRRNPHPKADGWQAATIRAILETRVTPTTGCGAGSTESTGSSTNRRRHGTLVRFEGSIPDTSPWRSAVR
jgi:hypothetical protein